jgi:hypothetical protein
MMVSPMQDVQQSLLEFDREELENLSPEDKREIFRGIIQSLLRKYDEGVTTGKMKELTGFSSNTVKAHLEYLVSTREAYKREYGGRTIIYFPNGKLCHHDILQKYILGGKEYSLKFISNPMGEFLYIQEQERDLDGGTRVAGGLVIDRMEIPRFAEILMRSYYDTASDKEKQEEQIKRRVGMIP